MDEHDHLFISYAYEDHEFAEWLTLRLTAAGYRVWCDKIQLLGGESYPRDIDRAIKERTFRVLALLSHHSISKPNPVKERTLALNIAKQRHVDFLIPLNVDGLLPAELDWMTSDLTFVPFHQGWAAALGQLLKKLDSVGAPKSNMDGKRMIRGWFTDNPFVVQAPESIWTNLIEVIQLPRSLTRLHRNDSDGAWPRDWPLYRKDDQLAWVFALPPDIAGANVRVAEVDWNAQPFDQDVRLVDVVTNLIKQHLAGHAISKGIVRSPDGRELYFPLGLLPKNRLTFQGYQGRQTWVQAVGERTFRQQRGLREKCRYHLAPVFRPMLRAYTQPVVQVQIRVHLTNSDGSALDSAKALRRRKAICRRWWNHEWLSRLIGVVQWLSEGTDGLCLADTPSGRLLVSSMPIQLTARQGIDEKRLGPLPTDDDEPIDEEFEGRRAGDLAEDETDANS